MSKINRKVGELNKKFEEQIILLKSACGNFDNNIEIAALQIATSIRVLLHDTNNSKSLLLQTNKKNIEFLDTSLDNINKGIYLGLVYKYLFGVVDGQGGEVLYKPLFTSSFHCKKINWISFEMW